MGLVRRRFPVSNLAAVLALALAVGPARAIAPAVNAVDAAQTAANLLAANPPLPMLRYNEGQWMLTVKPYIFNGEQDFTGDSGTQVRSTGEFNGWGAGLGYSYAWRERWGVYGMTIGSRTNKSDFRVSGPAAGVPTDSIQDILGATASFQFLSVGLVRQFWGEDPEGFVMPAFVGPLVVRTSFSQRVRETGGPSATVSPNAVHTDYDQDGSSINYGFMGGVQAAKNVGKFAVNPFLAGGIMTTELEGDIGTVRTSPAAGAQSTLNNSMGQDLGLERGWFASIGLNLTYRPWGLTFNVVSPFAKVFLLSSTEGLDMTLFTLSWSFGKYAK